MLMTEFLPSREIPLYNFHILRAEDFMQTQGRRTMGASGALAPPLRPILSYCCHSNQYCCHIQVPPSTPPSRPSSAALACDTESTSTMSRSPYSLESVQGGWAVEKEGQRRRRREREMKRRRRSKEIIVPRTKQINK